MRSIRRLTSEDLDAKIAKIPPIRAEFLRRVRGGQPFVRGAGLFRPYKDVEIRLPTAPEIISALPFQQKIFGTVNGADFIGAGGLVPAVQDEPSRPAILDFDPDSKPEG